MRNDPNSRRAPVIRSDEQKFLWTRVLPFLFLLYIVGYINRGNISFAFSGIESRLFLTTKALGMASGLFFVGYICFQLPSIFISNRKGSTLIMSLLPVFWSIFSIGNGFVKNGTELYLMQFLVGVSEGGFFPLAIIYISQHFPERLRATATSLFMMAVPISIVVSSPISMSLISLLGWRNMFAIEGIPGLLLGPAMYAILSKVTGTRNDKGLRDEKESEARENSESRFMYILIRTMKLPAVWMLSALWFFWLTALFAAVNWIPYILETSTGRSLLLLGAIISGIWVLSPLAMYFVSRQSDKTGKRVVFIEIQLVIALIGSVVLFSLNAYFSFMVIGFMLLATGLVGGMGIFWLLPSRFVPNGYSTVSIALVNTVGNLGGFVGPYLFGDIRYVSGSFQTGYYAITAIIATIIFIVYSLRFLVTSQKTVGTLTKSD